MLQMFTQHFSYFIYLFFTIKIFKVIFNKLERICIFACSPYFKINFFPILLIFLLGPLCLISVINNAINNILSNSVIE